MLVFPTDPASVNNRYEAPNGAIYIWDGSKWGTLNSVPPPGPTGPTGPTGSGTGGSGGANVTASDIAPTGPAVGDVWYDTASGRTYIYYDGTWVDSAPSMIGPTGPSVTGPTGEASTVTGPTGTTGATGAECNWSNRSGRICR